MGDHQNFSGSCVFIFGVIASELSSLCFPSMWGVQCGGGVGDLKSAPFLVFFLSLQVGG